MKRSTRVKGCKSKRVLGLLFYFFTFVLFYFPSPTPAAEQARGFGATLGGGTTDSVISALTANNTTRSYAFWAYRNGDGGSGAGRYFDKGNGFPAVYNDFSNGIVFRQIFTSGSLEWGMARPAANSWHHIVVTYNNSSSSNAPLMYMDGVSVSVFPVVTGGTGAATTTADGITIGNIVGVRVFDGILSQFAVWDRILTQPEITNLATTVGIYNGWAPSCYPTNLAEYIKLNDNPVTSSILANPTVTGTVQQTGLTIDYTCGAAPPAAEVIGGRRIIP